MKEWLRYKFLRARILGNRMRGKDNMHPETLSLWREVYKIENKHPEFNNRYHNQIGFLEQEGVFN